jgi:hypothetical protein
LNLIASALRSQSAGQEEADVAQQPEGRRDFVDEEVIRSFVGRVEPGGEIGTALAVWSVVLSIALVLIASLWWSLH